MQHLRLRTEFSFKKAYGPIERVVARVKELGCVSAGIADSGTWGHVQWDKACRAAGIKPIFGTEIPVVADAQLREKQPPNYMALLARNNDGLREIYEAVTLSTEQFYYIPRLDYKQIHELTDNVFVLTGSSPRWDLLEQRRNIYHENTFMQSGKSHLISVATADNFYPRAEDKDIYEIMLGKNSDDRTYPMHIPSETEMRNYGIDNYYSFNLSDQIAEACNAELPRAQMVRFKAEKSLEAICREAISTRCSGWNDIYEQRLQRELSLIKEKDYEDYFYVLWDALKFAKSKMLVGPARGSSCGSLVCYLLAITEIDPIPYGLLFERFIDVTRTDLPDIDIDFADTRRDLVFDYLNSKYGTNCVARLGTILRFKAKSAITTVADSTLVPPADIMELKGQIIERSGGDSRARFCIMDTFETLDIGKAVLEKHPQMRYAGDLEYHASHSGQHAAGIVVTQEPVSWFCSYDRQKGALQVDKIDAEEINLLKIDALGLRTLSVLQDILDQIDKDYEWLYRLPTNDIGAFKVLNDKRYAGVFQFEGYALQSFTSQMTIEELNDIIAITALARPGPLNSGSATDYVERRTGRKPIEYLPMCDEFTSETYGTLIYQEQIMQIVRNVGKFSWEDTSIVRKAMSKSYGEEFFDKLYVKFEVGAVENGLSKEESRNVWDHLCTFGSWGFNKSHAVAYGIISYWCCYLKAHHPLEFAVANLRNAKDDANSIKLLREFSREGFKYTPFDINNSEVNWSIKDGVLVGGFTGIKGCGIKKAETIIAKRKNNKPLTPSELRMVNHPLTPWDDIFECQTKFGHIKSAPEQYNIETPIMDIGDITGKTEGSFLIFGKIKEKKLRDMNETVKLAERGGKKVTKNTLWLNLVVEDDTGSIICQVNRFIYEKWGKPIIETMVEDEDWLLIKGDIKRGFRLVAIEKWRHLTKGNKNDRENDRKAIKG